MVVPSPSAPDTMQEHLGWPVWLLQRNHYNLRSGTTRAPRAHARRRRLGSWNWLWSRLAASLGALVVVARPSVSATMQEHLGRPVLLLQRNCYNLRGGAATRAPATRTHRRRLGSTDRLWSRLASLMAFPGVPLLWGGIPLHPGHPHCACMLYMGHCFFMYFAPSFLRSPATRVTR